MMRRLNNWNYSNDGYYFVTICTKDKVKYFGQVKDERVMLNKVGQSALNFWKIIPKSYNNIILDEFIVMPNHIHGILIIRKDPPASNAPRRDLAGSEDRYLGSNTLRRDLAGSEDRYLGSNTLRRDLAGSEDRYLGSNTLRRDLAGIESRYLGRTRRGALLPKSEFKRDFGPLQKDSISSVVNHFKGNVTKWCKQNDDENFAWKKKFHDRVIRNEQELHNVRNYILNNPLKWKFDRNYLK